MMSAWKNTWEKVAPDFSMTETKALPFAKPVVQSVECEKKEVDWRFVRGKACWLSHQVASVLSLRNLGYKSVGCYLIPQRSDRWNRAWRGVWRGLGTFHPRWKQLHHQANDWQQWGPFERHAPGIQEVKSNSPHYSLPCGCERAKQYHSEPIKYHVSTHL